MSLVLDEVIPTPQQTEILYRQLMIRSNNISHKKIPELEEHAHFVSHHPYRAWYLVTDDKCVIGNVYVQFDNSIGLNCTVDITKQKISIILNMIMFKMSPLDAIPSVRHENYSLNVASSNSLLQKKLLNLGLVESQRTYTLDKKFIQNKKE